MFRILGQNASFILQIMSELGTSSKIRIRLRGVGSGFKEGPLQIECQEPLHFSISAEDENVMIQGVQRVRDLIEKARSELAAATAGVNNSGASN